MNPHPRVQAVKVFDALAALHLPVDHETVLLPDKAILDGDISCLPDVCVRASQFERYTVVRFGQPTLPAKPAVAGAAREQQKCCAKE